MSVSSQTLRCFTPLSSSKSSSSNYQWRRSPATLGIARCSPSAVVLEALIPDHQPPPPQPPPPPPPLDEEDNLTSTSNSPPPPNFSGIQVPRQRYISVSKSELLDAIVSSMFPSPEEATQFLALSQCLDSILHAEHKTILEEMRSYYDDLTLSTKTLKADDSPAVANEDSEHEEDDESHSKFKLSFPLGFTLDFNLLLNLSSNSAQRNSINTSRAFLPGHFQRAFMRLLKSAEFEELSPRDLTLTSALNTDYLLTLPIYIDWKKASVSNVVIFRRGYTTEKEKGLLIAEKLDYLQSKLLQNILFLIAKPLGRLGVWLDEIFKSIIQMQDTEVLAKRFKRWLENLSLSLKPNSYDGKLPDELDGIDNLSSELPIWVAAQKAITLYEGILSEFGPRERLLRKFSAWVGLIPSIPEEAFDLHLDSSSSESSLRPSFLPRISLSDIWKPASPRSCGNDFQKMLRTAISILFSRSTLQEPAFRELVLLYIDDNGESETPDEVPSLQMKIYEEIPIPDLPVVFPHKKLSFRILDAVRLDAATILGLLAYFFSYKFVNILSSPSALFLDATAATALVIYVFRVLLGYKQTRDRYQLLVNKTLYEKTIASGFGSIHFLLDASEQQQYKEAILVYAILLKAEREQVKSTIGIGHKCESFLYDAFGEKVEMPVDKAIDTLLRLGLVVNKGGQLVHPIPCTRASTILRNRWNTLIA